MRFCLGCHGYSATIIKCSTIGPSANAGTNVNAPTRITTPTRNTTKSGVWVGSVPALTGVAFFRANEPAIAKRGNGQPVAGN